MLNTTTKYGLVPPGKEHSLTNLFRHANAVMLFNSPADALEFLSLQTVDNKDYFKTVLVSLTMNETKGLVEDE